MNVTMKTIRATSFVGTLLIIVSCTREDARTATRLEYALPVQIGDSAIADSLLDEGEAVYFRSQYDSARAILLRGGGGSRAKGDSAGYARALTWLGLTAWRQGNYPEARAAGERALAIKEKLRLVNDLFRSYNALGLLAHNEGRFGDASRMFDRARSAAAAVNDSVSIAKAVGNLGLVYADVGEFDKSRVAFETLQRIANAGDDARSEGNALSNLGMVSIRSGDPAAALRFLDSARTLYGTAEYPAGQEAALGQMGSAYDALGDFDRAISHMDSAVALARKHGLKQPEADNLQIIGEMLGEAGDHQRALQYLARARAIAESTGLDSRLGDIQRAEAREYASLSRFDVALARARGAADAHRKAGASIEELNDQLLYADIAQRGGRARDSDGALAIADALAAKIGSPIARASAMFGRAAVADRAGNAPEALRLLDKMGNEIRLLGASAVWEAHSMRARAFARLARWEDAAREGRLAVAGVEKVRGGMPPGPLRAAYAADKSAVYSDLVLALLRLGLTAEAFEVADAGRGKALLERIGGIATTARNQASRDLAESERLLRQIDWLVEQLRRADSIPPRDRSVALRTDLADLSRRLANARRDYEDRVQRATRAHPEAAAVLGVSRVSTRDVLAALRPDEVLVQYFPMQHALITFVATRRDVRYLESTISVDELATKVRLASSVASRESSDAERRPVLRSLHELLILPLNRSGFLRSGQSLTIVPHSALDALPFAALVDRRGKYLVQSHSILMLASAAMLPVSRQRATTEVPGGTTVLAPFNRLLPGTEAEAMMVAQQLSGARIRRGGAANETALRTALLDDDVVHIASHAVVNHVSPMFSRVEVAASPQRNSQNDGRLEVHELLELPVRSSLVFLSGCESGAATAWTTSFKRAADYSTLAQAFLFSGAQDVVATLWRIDDRAAAEFARRFYVALPTRSVPEALAVAQREMMLLPRYSAPRFWAPYTASGSGRLKTRPQKDPTLAVK